MTKEPEALPFKIAVSMPETDCLHCWLCTTIMAYGDIHGKDHDASLAGLIHLLAEFTTLSPDPDASIQKVREQLTAQLAIAKEWIPSTIKRHRH